MRATSHFFPFSSFPPAFCLILTTAVEKSRIIFRGFSRKLATLEEVDVTFRFILNMNKSLLNCFFFQFALLLRRMSFLKNLKRR